MFFKMHSNQSMPNERQPFATSPRDTVTRKQQGTLLNQSTHSSLEQKAIRPAFHLSTLLIRTRAP
ncbi:hypothetical protein WM40_21145 [Robbsia andropogonis]|uniref:Uncharacterized protein n=1 Tax=Robbsia andropogonis TaxID=28092 RepID=A0A0F5JVB5_9BURK|nr:hypothetical protein WM40_21145 [Robbsia andropogonis]